MRISGSRPSDYDKFKNEIRYGRKQIFLPFFALGFIPSKIDGKRHELKVELTREAREKYKGVELKFRPEYVP